MSVAVETARSTVRLTTGKSRDRSVGSLVFVGLLWFSLFFGVMVLVVLITDLLDLGRIEAGVDLAQIEGSGPRGRTASPRPRIGSRSQVQPAAPVRFRRLWERAAGASASRPTRRGLTTRPT
mgnify:CR=1 FL=1